MADIKEVRRRLVGASLPDEFIAGTRINWSEIQRVLGLPKPEDVWAAIVFLYQVDPEVNDILNTKFIVLAKQVMDGKALSMPMVPTDAGEAEFFMADEFCTRCPGSEKYELAPGMFFPRCMNITRPQKWVDCIKYREKVESAKLTDEERELILASLRKDIESVNGSGENAG